MEISAADLIRIVESGGTVIMKGKETYSDYTTADLMTIAEAGKESKGELILHIGSD